MEPQELKIFVLLSSEQLIANHPLVTLPPSHVNIWSNEMVYVTDTGYDVRQSGHINDGSEWSVC